MSTYKDIRFGRGLIWAGIVLGYGLAVTVAVLNLTSEDGTVLTALGFLVMLSIPSTMAVYSLDRRPSLLTAAGMAALFQGFLLLSSAIGLLNIVVVIVWYLGSQRRPRPAVTPRWATWVRPVLGFAAILPFLVLFMHLDPRCTFTDRDGNVRVEEATDFPSGWRFSQEGGLFGGTSSSWDATARTCSSDTIQPWETGVSIVLSAGILALVSRWPTVDAIERGQTDVPEAAVGRGRSPR